LRWANTFNVTQVFNSDSKKRKSNEKTDLQGKRPLLQMQHLLQRLSMW
jgi:hypothetical protein